MTNRQRIIDYCKAHPEGSGCEDWERDLGLSHQTASAMLTELCDDGTLVETGEKYRTKSGGTGRKVVLANTENPVGLF